MEIEASQPWATLGSGSAIVCALANARVLARRAALVPQGLGQVE